MKSGVGKTPISSIGSNGPESTGGGERSSLQLYKVFPRLGRSSILLAPSDLESFLNSRKKPPDFFVLVELSLTPV